MKHRKDAMEAKRGVPGRWPLALAVGLALASASAMAAPTQYRVVNLGPGEGGFFINAKGQVAFFHADPFSAVSEAWFYDGARRHRIGTLGGAVTSPRGMNDLGQVTGVSETANGLIHSFVWSLRGGMRDIGTLPGMNATWDPVINNRGEIAGYSTGDPSPPYAHAFRWSATGGIEDLGVLQAGANADSYARAINDAGLIAGSAWAGNIPSGGSYSHAFVWTRNGGMVDIDTLGHHYSSPVAVSATGLVAGNSMDPANDNAGRVFWWTRATGMRELGSGGGQGTWMVGMSSGGRIAGVIIFPNGSQHAMTWTQDYGMRDLGTLGGHGSNAQAANNKGQVVGGAVTRDDRFHAFVWSRQEGMVDLNRRLLRAPAGLELRTALGINESGMILAASNAGLVLLKPVQACGCGHALGAIASPGLVQPGAAVDASVGIAAGDGASRYRISWSWGDGTAERARDVDAARGGASAAARHNYAAPGIYTITADVSDEAGNSARVSRRIVVAEPAGGAIAGSGTVQVPSTTNRRAPDPGGTAEFSFLAPPAGIAQASKGSLYFGAPGFVFASKDARVFASKGTRAQLVGTGTLNGEGGYRFTASVAGGASDGQAGRFGLKISHTDPKTLAEVIDYDGHEAGGNGRPLAEGRIVAQ